MLDIKNYLRILLSIIIGFFIGKKVINYFTDNIILIRL
jgi:hypothetical protein